MARGLFFIAFLILTNFAFCQPFINSVEPISAGFDETVTISGSGFSNTSNQNIVYFGTGRVTSIVSATDNLLVVKVPSNASSGPITVLNTATSLTASFSTNFVYSFGSTNSFSTDNFRTQDDIATNEVQTYDVCSCDFNSDGLNDLVVTNNETPSDPDDRSELLLYTNTSTTSATSFSGPVRLGDQPTIKVVCGDLNGDGNPDIVATEGANSRNEVFIFQNDGTGGFPSAPNLTLTLPRDESDNIRNPETLEIADLDGDGFLDIVVGNGSNEEIDVFRNLSSAGGNISFSTNEADVIQIAIQASGLTNEAIRGLALGDLNGDNMPEIVVSELSDERIFVLRNESTSGSIAFGDPITVSVASAQLRNLELGDLNGDGFMDIVATDVRLGSSNGNVVLVENITSTTGVDPTFGTPIVIPSLANTWGAALGDIDGDGDLDIAIASESAETGSILINNTVSTITETSFTTDSYSLNFNSRNIGMTDLNGDSKTDLFFTSNSLTGQLGFISVIVNQNCVVPVIDPSSGTYCNGDGTTIMATNINTASYSWNVNGSNTASSNTLDISTNSADLTVSVTLSTAHDGCSQTSSNATYLNSTVATPTPNITTNPASVCAGDALTLTTNATAVSYIWSGPNGVQDTTSAASFAVNNISANGAGIYTLQTRSSSTSCYSAPDSLTVEVFSVPTLTILNQNEDLFCDGGQATLNTRNISPFTYQWLQDNQEISGASTNSLTVNSSGSYSTRITDENNCSSTSVPLSITEATRPEVLISGDSEICIDVPLELISNSFGFESLTLNQNWTINDSGGSLVQESSTDTISFTSATSGLFQVSLIIGYQEIANCESTLTDTITVSDVPTIPVITPNGTEKCPSDSLLLAMPSELLSYQWVDITNGRSDTLSRYEGLDSAFVTTQSNEESTTIQVTVLDNIGCIVTSTQEVRNFPNSGVAILSNEIEIIDNAATIPPRTNGVDLFADGGSDFLWQPGNIFSDSLSSSVTVFPRSSSQLISLTATDINDCRETAQITLNNDNLLPRTGFSPNGDGVGFECWEILNSSNIAGCTVYIFDSRGRNIQVADSPFVDDCVWDGTSEGVQVPVGLYYYVMKCDDSQLNQSGTILLAR